MSKNQNEVLKQTSFLTSNNLEFIEEVFTNYSNNPNSIPNDWKSFFDGLGGDKESILKDILGPSWAPKKKHTNGKPAKISNNNQNLSFQPDANSARDSIRAMMLIRAYRIRGHLLANIDPLGLMKREEHSELNLETFGFEKKDLNKKIYLDGFLGLKESNLNKIYNILKTTYCSNIGFEYMHMSDPAEKTWFRDRIEGLEAGVNFTNNGRKAIYNKIVEAEGFEKFLHVKFVGTKRFGLDGGESLVPALEQIIKRGGALGVKEVKIGMPHRGRLNILANVMNKPYKLSLIHI